MTDEKITHITIDEIRARIARGDASMTAAVIDMMTDEEIEAAMRDDPDWKDHIDEDWSKAELVIPKEAMDQLVQVAVDAVAEVDWVRGLFGSGYGCAQDVMRDALTAALSAALEREAKPQCCMCGKKDLSTAEGDDGGECELSLGRWTCSQECWERAVDLQPVAIYRHKKRGTLYRVLYHGRLQVDGDLDNQIVTVYQGEDGQVWVRPDHEFKDGGFERVSAAFTSPADIAAEADEHDGASAIFSAEVPIAWLRAARAAHKGGAE